jgi:KUP system potassium uptake protein
MIQSRGTTRVGMLFGPVMIVWFVTSPFLGVNWIVKEPRVLAAFNPLHA